MNAAMKRRALAAALLVMGACPVAWPQDQVQIYGLLDAGVTVFSNVNGGRMRVVDTGIQQANRLGFRGSEDLGGGNKALFTLENGFAADTGTVAQGGVFFGRQAYVGLSNRYGSITLGRQYDFMGELGLYANAAQIGGLYAWHLGNLNRLAGERFNNSVKFTSARVNDFSFGVLYSLGEVPGDFTKGSAFSAGLDYLHGPMKVAAAYTQARNAPILPYNFMGLSRFQGVVTPAGAAVMLDKITNAGVGGTYTMGPIALRALFTWTKFSGSATSSALKVYEAGLSYQIKPELIAAGGYTYSSMAVNHWGQFVVGLDYFLSKRTDFYVTVNSQHASGPGVVAVLAAQTPSSDQDQTAFRIGMRTKF